MQNSHLGKLHKDLGPHWNDKGIAELANRLNLSLLHYARTREKVDQVLEIFPEPGRLHYARTREKVVGKLDQLI